MHTGRFLPGYVETFRDNLVGYLAKLVSTTVESGKAAARLLLTDFSPPVLLIIAAASLAIAVRSGKPAGTRPRPLRIVALFAFAISAGWFAQIATGYTEKRYFLAGVFLWIVAFVFLAIWRAEARASYLLVPAFLTSAALLAWDSLAAFANVRKEPLVSQLSSELALPRRFAPLVRCLPADARVLMSGPVGWDFGPLTGMMTIYRPFNWPFLSAKHQLFYVSRFNVTHVFGPFALAEQFPDAFEPVSCSGRDLYRLRPERRVQPLQLLLQPHSSSVRDEIARVAAGAARIAADRILVARAPVAGTPKPDDIVEYSLVERGLIERVVPAGDSLLLILDGPVPLRHRGTDRVRHYPLPTPRAAPGQN
jgi:hypothetical protein